MNSKQTEAAAATAAAAAAKNCLNKFYAERVASNSALCEHKIHRTAMRQYTVQLNGSYIIFFLLLANYHVSYFIIMWVIYASFFFFLYRIGRK